MPTIILMKGLREKRSKVGESGLCAVAGARTEGNASGYVVIQWNMGSPHNLRRIVVPGRDVNNARQTLMTHSLVIITIAATMPVTLPTELWIRILSLIANDLNDRPKLWVSGRAVCTAFKETIETIFREKHLPKTFIQFHLG
jgi:hypothetical protein